MSKVKITYNPFKLETAIWIEGELVRENSVLNVGSKRLQEWVENLPTYLYEECNENEFDLEFVGTKMDLEDVEEVVEKAQSEGITIHLTHIPVRELDHMEKRIEDIFQELIEGPIDELKTEDLKASFQQALNDEFEITVVATMSAGKSTLINALLQQKIMPSSQEACTATISRIKDTDDTTFTAIPHPTYGEPFEAIEGVTLEQMNVLNNDENISMIELHGDIPFTDTKETSLVLIDTPGPNNSRDENHLKMTYKNLSESSKTLVLYILNATQLGVNDDSKLLDAVAESMKVGGKQSKDRYLFVVNKLDQFRKGEDNVEMSLAKVRKYLANRGIEDPHLFPASALPALDIRQILNHPDEVDEELEDEIGPIIRKLNRNEELHLEKYASLTPSVRRKVEAELETVEDQTIYSLESALIHTGIPGIEHMIKLYVDKYARTAKVKNVVDTFQQKLESSLAFEKMKETIARQTGKHTVIKAQIDALTEKIQYGKESEVFKRQIERLNPVPEIEREAEQLLQKHNEAVSETMAGLQQDRLELEEAEALSNDMFKLAENFSASLHAKLEVLIEKKLNKTAYQLLDEYRQKVTRLMDGIQIEGLDFEPYELVQGELVFNEQMIQQLVYEETVKVGEEVYKNPEREGFLGFFKFTKPKYLSRDLMETKEFVDGSEFGELFLAEIEINIRKMIRNICEDASHVVENMKQTYQGKFKEVDRVLLTKLETLNRFTHEAANIGDLLEQSQRKFEWLEEMEAKINNIIELEIIQSEEDKVIDHTTV